MNDVSVARGVMTCLLPNVINDTLYEVLTELTVRPIFKAWDAVRNIMLQNCLYSNNFIIVRLPTQMRALMAAIWLVAPDLTLRLMLA